MFNNCFFENLAVYEIMWKSSVEPDTPQMTIWRMRIACQITDPTTQSQNVYYLIAFARQEWLNERASVLHSTYVHCLLRCRLFDDNHSCGFLTW